MVWTSLDKDGKARYIHKNGSFVFLSKSKDNALDHIPIGYKVVRKKGKLSLIRIKY